MERIFHKPTQLPDPDLGLIVHGYGSGYLDLPQGFRIINKMLDNGKSGFAPAVMFRCTQKPTEINTGALPVYEFTADLIWDKQNSFLVGQDRYDLVTDVVCKGSGAYIFYGMKNGESD